MDTKPPPSEAQRRDFILANTKRLTPPLVPELSLHLAEESLPIWRKTEEELGEAGLPPPYWAFAWAGGQALARYLLDNPASVAGRRVIDLGTGSGLTAIAAAKAGAASVLASDIDAYALTAVRLNASANGVTVDVEPGDLLTGPPPPCDVLLVGDLFYERPLAERVLVALRDGLARGTVAYAGDPGRSYFPDRHFVRVAEYSVPVTRELEDAEIKRTAVWRFTG